MYRTHTHNKTAEATEAIITAQHSTAHYSNPPFYKMTKQKNITPFSPGEKTDGGHQSPHSTPRLVLPVVLLVSVGSGVRQQHATVETATTGLEHGRGDRHAQGTCRSSPAANGIVAAVAHRRDVAGLTNLTKRVGTEARRVGYQ